MNSCKFNTPACDQRDILPIRFSLRKDVMLACRGCRDCMAASATIRLVERRMADVPVSSDRRRRVARWISANLARDWTELSR